MRGSFSLLFWRAAAFPCPYSSQLPLSLLAFSLLAACKYYGCRCNYFQAKHALDADASSAALQGQLAQSRADAQAAREALRESEVNLGAARERAEQEKAQGLAAAAGLRRQLVRLVDCPLHPPSRCTSASYTFF